MAFDPIGVYLAVGCSGGLILSMDVPSLTNIKSYQKLPMNIEKTTILNLEFSKDARFLAASDSGFSVLAYRLYFKAITKSFRSKSDIKWELLGIQQVHSRHIINITFLELEDSDYPHLLSLGEDRKLIEYEFLKGKKLQLLQVFQIEQTAIPLGMVWDPYTNDHLLIANNECKIKLYDTKVHKYRRTALAPFQQSSFKKMKILSNKVGSIKENLVLCSNECIFLCMLPVDGNPYKNVSVLAHPNGINNIDCSFDGEYIFTTGDNGKIIFMWHINSSVLYELAKKGGSGMTPFYDMLPGVREKITQRD